MGKKRTPGLTRKRNGIWLIDKVIEGHGRLCESTRTADADGAERYLARRITEISDGTPPAAAQPGPTQRLFREAREKYLNEHSHKRSIERNARALADLEAFIGDKPLEHIYADTLKPYVEARTLPVKGARKRKPLSIGTINRHLAVVSRILVLAAREWRDPVTHRPWLPCEPPRLKLKTKYKARQPYSLSWDEQQLLFSELAPHLRRMARFAVNTGLRAEELCGLKWDWEIRDGQLVDADGVPLSRFKLPEEATKNAEERIVVLNDTAREVLEDVRGDHDEYVFTFENCKGVRNRVGRFLNNGWKAARRRAAARYKAELGTEAPEGFKRVRVHDLRHTFGRRLRAAGVSLEDRQNLLGHKNGSITTHYCAAELENLLKAVRAIQDETGPTSRAVVPRIVRDCRESERKLLVEREGLEPSTPAL